MVHHLKIVLLIKKTIVILIVVTERTQVNQEVVVAVQHTRENIVIQEKVENIVNTVIAKIVIKSVMVVQKQMTNEVDLEAIQMIALIALKIRNTKSEIDHGPNPQIAMINISYIYPLTIN